MTEERLRVFAEFDTSLELGTWPEPLLDAGRFAIAHLFKETRGAKLVSVLTPASMSPKFMTLAFDNGVEITLDVREIRKPPPERVNFWNTPEGLTRLRAGSEPEET